RTNRPSPLRRSLRRSGLGRFVRLGILLAPSETSQHPRRQEHSKFPSDLHFLSRSSECTVILAPDLLQLVEQSFVADSQLLRRPAPVPSRARQGFQNKLLFGLPRGCA